MTPDELRDAQPDDPWLPHPARGGAMSPNPCPESTGMLLFEHYELHQGEYYLLNIAASPVGMRLSPGDVIFTRRWGPAGLATTYNQAAPERQL